MHWKKGPAWWTTISYKVFSALLLTNYIIIPGVNIIVALYFIFKPSIDLKQEPIESYIVFFMIVCSTRILEYFTLIRRTVILDAKIFLQTQTEIGESTNEELRMELLMDDAKDSSSMGARMTESKRACVREILGERESYLTRVRGYGQGDVRIGKSMDLNDDMYALGFIS